MTKPKRMRPAKVEQNGDRWRVVEADGTPCGTDRHPSDGGGFAEERSALHLAAQINERRSASR